ncbi:hypothetical protein BGZ65_010735 [Modicella reniformis]|uniref:Cytochrome c oxidase assembly factor 6 n=1 Tax=Modicella reniformis TaxID=1440133 RepID=A0A9P6IPF3_9FUNG|nr:hypothetical protein BGZ65_010735 [Modicella reniformis]
MAQEAAHHPTRADRQKCWKRRDAYFACLGESNVLDPTGPEAAGVCQELGKKYQGACMKSWVEYFNKRRVLEVEQKEILERMRAQHRAAEKKAAEAKTKA